jgi:hypothetical protein
MKSPRFTLADISRKSPAIQKQVQTALYGGQPVPQPIQPPRSSPACTPDTPQPRKTKGNGRQRVSKHRNGGIWSEARYWQAIRSGLRRTFRFWKPAVDALHAARVPMKGPRGQKWAYLCCDCRKLFKRRAVEIDHVTPCGVLTAFEHIPGFIQRLTPESPEAFKIRCLKCHQAKTAAEREAR